MKRTPIGFIATCQCGVVIGALDYQRTDRKEAGRIIGQWLHDGCAVAPKFDAPWSVTVFSCVCALVDGGKGKGEGR